MVDVVALDAVVLDLDVDAGSRWVCTRCHLPGFSFAGASLDSLDSLDDDDNNDDDHDTNDDAEEEETKEEELEFVCCVFGGFQAR